VTKPTPDYLRLVDPTVEQPLLGVNDTTLLLRTCEAFEQVTGWPLQYSAGADAVQNPNLVWSAPVDPGVGASLGLIRPGFLPPASGSAKSPGLLGAVALSEAVVQLWAEITALRKGLRSREAELGAEVPVIATRETAARTAERFEAILKAGAESVGCQAAALYLLDSETTSLKMRACWGLPELKLLEAARELAGSLADLEALLGHAVVLSDPSMNRYWHGPEQAGASVCVPVSSPTTPLGTLWIFSDLPRDFNDHQTNLIEVIAGRLAAELERQVLLGDARQNQAQRREVTHLAERQIESLPRSAPLADGWKVVGRLVGATDGAADSQFVSAFFDWFRTEDEHLAMTLGSTSEVGIGGALVAAQLRSALRAQVDGSRGVDRALVTAHDVLGSLSCGSQGASAFYGLVPVSHHPSPRAGTRRRSVDGEIRFAVAGQAHALLLTAKGYCALAEPCEALTSAASDGWSEIRGRLNPGDALLVYIAGPGDPRWQRLAAARELLVPQLVDVFPCNAERLAAAAAEAIEQAAQAAGRAADGALLVIQAS
jgi:phosphoserine phosphatase RsbU/P